MATLAEVYAAERDSLQTLFTIKLPNDNVLARLYGKLEYNDLFDHYELRVPEDHAWSLSLPREVEYNPVKHEMAVYVQLVDAPKIELIG